MLRTIDATRLAAAADARVRREVPDATDNTRERLVTAVTNLLESGEELPQFVM